MDLQLSGKRALVTGGSRGIGKAAAAALLAEGAQVAIAARDPERLSQAAADLGGGPGGGRAVPAIEADTGDDASVRNLVVRAQELLGGVDILVNCAARPAGQAPPPSLREITTEAFWPDVNVKVLGYLRCAQAVAPGMLAAGAEPAEIEQRMGRGSLSGRLTDAAEVAAVIAFLASPVSAAINGESIACGGGQPGVIRY